MPDIPVNALIAVYASVETIKALSGKIFGRNSTPDFDAHHDLCRECAMNQKATVEHLAVIRDTVVKVCAKIE